MNGKEEQRRRESKIKHEKECDKISKWMSVKISLERLEKKIYKKTNNRKEEGGMIEDAR